MTKTRIILILLIISLLFGGCMNTNNAVNEDTIKANMYSYINQKYDKTFTERDFILAVRGLDSNNYDTLVLEDENGIVFNVFSNADEKKDDYLFDDYAASVIDRSFTDYLRENSTDPDVFVYAEANLVSENSISVDMVSEMSTNDLISNFELSSMTVAIRINDSSIKKHIEDVYNIYGIVNELNPKYIDFEIISSQKADEKLISTLNNMRLKFESDWSKYESVTEKCVISDLRLTKEEIISQIEEV